MEVRLTTIAAFLIGAGLVGLVLWIRSENNGVVTQSTIQDIVYKQQAVLKDQIAGTIDNKNAISDYVTKINIASDEMSRLAYLKYLHIKAEDAEFDVKIQELFNTVDAIRNSIFRNIYNNAKLPDQSLADKELDNSFLNIDQEIFKYFRFLYDYTQGLSTDLATKNKNKEGLVSLLRDTVTLKNATTSIAAKMKFESGRLSLKVKSIDTDVEQKTKEIEAQNDSLKEVEKSSKDRLLMVVVLPVFAIIIVLLFVIPYLYRSNDNVLKLFFEDKIILQVFTVFILVITILLLGIGDKIKAETLGTLLGGISVYVLQNALTGNTGKKSADKDGEQTS